MMVLWDADVDSRPVENAGWQPFATDETGNVLFSIPMWFETEADCRRWITDTVVGRDHVAGWDA